MYSEKHKALRPARSFQLHAKVPPSFPLLSVLTHALEPDTPHRFAAKQSPRTKKACGSEKRKSGKKKKAKTPGQITEAKAEK